ncbi:cation:proton antiporter [Streptomyces sp. NPDC056982]|uniref:cation:proton antiporter domain-containing protein n=1 Tax=Streptomyces sp. NPDC056982 TaxID=3345986 RepID=UPI00362ED16F
MSIGAGWLLAWPLLPGLTRWELALVGAVLAPTDEALGKTDMSSPRVPALVRHGLNVESGLNDGMVRPFFVLFLAAIVQEGEQGVFWRALVLSSILGVLVGVVGGQLLKSAQARGWVSCEWAQLFVPAVAAAAYAVGGNGFIAAWIGGFALRRFPAAEPQEDLDPLHLRDVPDRTAPFTEHLGEFLASLSLLIFGAVLLGPTLENLSWGIVGYAVLSLTVVRMLPVAVALAGSGLGLPMVVDIEWFGPRGLASVVLGPLLLEEEHVQGVELLARVVAVTVGLSVLLHLRRLALADQYGSWLEKTTATGRKLREGHSRSRVHTGPRRERES